MTLLVGAIFPSDDLLSPGITAALRQLSSQAGAIIAADSRWTFPNGRTEDGAVKMFGVHTNALGAFAGSVAAGEDVIIALSSEVLATNQTFAAHVQGTIASVWHAHQPNDDGLEVLLAYAYESGHAWLGHFSSVDDFTPHEVQRMEVIGPERAQTHFRQALRAAIIENGNRANTAGQSISVESSAALIMAVINDVCELQTHETVGGKIICGLTMFGQPRGIGATRLSIGASGALADEIGLNVREGQTLREGFEYVPPHEG